MASVFINLETSNKWLRCVNWENKSTSPLTILPSFVETSSVSNAVDIEEQQPPEPASWHQDDPDSTQLSTQVDLESDTSIQQSDDSLIIESEGLYEPVIKNPNCPSVMDGAPKSTLLVCMAKSQSETTTEFSSKSSVERSDSTMIQNENEADLWGKEENGFNRLAVVNYPMAKTQLQPFPPSVSKLQIHKDDHGKTTISEELKLINSNTPAALNRQIRKQRTKTPPAVMFKRNRDIVNGVQSPLSPLPGSFRSMRKFSIDESRAINQGTRIINKKLSQSVTLGYNQNGSGKAYLHRDRLQTLADIDTADDSISLIRGVDSPLPTPKTMATMGAIYSQKPELPYKTNQNSAAVEDSLNISESQNTMSFGESNYHNSSDSSGISVNFTSLTLVNNSVDIMSVSQFSPEDEEAQASAEQKVSNVKVAEIVEPTSPFCRKHSDASDRLAITKRYKQEEVNIAEDSIISTVLTENAVTRPSYLPAESMRKSSSLTDALYVQQETPKLESEDIENETPMSLNRPQSLTVEAEQKKEVHRSPEITISHIPSCFSRVPLETISSLTDLDETPVPENHPESLKLSNMQLSDPVKTPTPSTPLQVTTTAPLNQIYFPKSTRIISQSPVGPSSRPQNENCQTKETVLINGAKENTRVNNSKKTVGSTKLTRSSHVTKRPQTVSVSRGIGKSLTYSYS